MFDRSWCKLKGFVGDASFVFTVHQGQAWVKGVGSTLSASQISSDPSWSVQLRAEAYSIFNRGQRS